MTQTLIAKSSTSINAPLSKVWDALTNPEIIKVYLFGTDCKTDWKVGSPITYSGTWNGKPYKDTGTILKFDPEKEIQTSYWSNASGLEDKPENYKIVSYLVSENNGQTTVTITQDNNPTEEARVHSEKNWEMVLKTMKEFLEK